MRRTQLPNESMRPTRPKAAILANLSQLYGSYERWRLDEIAPCVSLGAWIDGFSRQVISNSPKNLQMLERAARAFSRDERKLDLLTQPNKSAIVAATVKGMMQFQAHASRLGLRCLVLDARLKS